MPASATFHAENGSSGTACSRRGFLLTGASAALLLRTRPGAAAESLRVGSLRFGSVNWLLDTVDAEGLAASEGVAMERVDLASNQATVIALQARDVDIIVSDWLWALRQRSEGQQLLFRPYSKALGAVMVPPDSDITGLADLEGKTIGVAGSPLDKSWLLLRAHARDSLGADLAEIAEPTYGAPPLLSEQIKLGRLDALLTFWNFVARLEAEGYRPVIEMDDVMRELGIEPPPPLIGFVWFEDLMETQGDTVAAFFRAIDRGYEVLDRSDEAWERLRPVMKAGSQAEFEQLRARFRAGIPTGWDDAHLAAAERLFGLMAELGGAELVGPHTRFDPALFWAPHDQQ